MRQEREERIKNVLLIRMIKMYTYGSSQNMFLGAFSFSVSIRIHALWKNNALHKF